MYITYHEYRLILDVEVIDVLTVAALDVKAIGHGGEGGCGIVLKFMIKLSNLWNKLIKLNTYSVIIPHHNYLKIYI